MKHGSYDLASVATMIEVGSVRTRRKDLLHQRLVTRQGSKRSQKAGEAERRGPRRAKLEAVSAPGRALSTSRGLPEGIGAGLGCRIEQKSCDRLTIGNMRAGAERGRELTLTDGHGILLSGLRAR